MASVGGVAVNVGGLISRAGDVVWDWAGVVYSEELSELAGSVEVDAVGMTMSSLLMVVFMIRSASKVEVKGSLASSSPA